SPMKTKVLLGLPLLLIPVLIGCSDRTADTASATPAAPAAKVMADVNAWVDATGDRGKVMVLYSKDPATHTYPESIVLRLTTAQLLRFEADSKKFLNEPDPLFTKAVIVIGVGCANRTTHHEGTADDWLVFGDHDEPSSYCAAAIP